MNLLKDVVRPALLLDSAPFRQRFPALIAQLCGGSKGICRKSSQEAASLKGLAVISFLCSVWQSGNLAEYFEQAISDSSFFDLLLLKPAFLQKFIIVFGVQNVVLSELHLVQLS